LLGAGHAVAQNQASEHDSHHATPAASSMSEGEVRKVDKVGGAYLMLTLEPEKN